MRLVTKFRLTRISSEVTSELRHTLIAYSIILVKSVLVSVLSSIQIMFVVCVETLD
jgi:hypothetical protein